jgi:hypothetical protein
VFDGFTLFRIEVLKIRNLGTLKGASRNGRPLETGRIGQIERRIAIVRRTAAGLLARLR